MSKPSKEPEKEEKQEKEIRLDKDCLSRVLSLKKDIEETPDDDFSERFYEIVRDFFKKHFRIDYEFSYQELAKEIENQDITDELKRDMKEFAKDLSEMGFDKGNNHDISEKIVDFEDILIKITLKDQHTKKKDPLGFIKNLFRPRAKKKTHPLKNLLSRNNNLDEIYSLFRECYDRLKCNSVREAEEILEKLLEKYSKLTKNQKKHFEKEIEELKDQVHAIEEDPAKWRVEEQETDEKLNVEPFHDPPEKKSINFEPYYCYDENIRLERAPKLQTPDHNLLLVNKAGQKFRAKDKSKVDNLKKIVNSAKKSIENGNIERAREFYSKAIRVKESLELDSALERTLDYDLMVMEINLKLEEL